MTEPMKHIQTEIEGRKDETADNKTAMNTELDRIGLANGGGTISKGGVEIKRMVEARSWEPC
jgi:hypothetical protein